MTHTGNFSFVLHSHLPYVLSHGRWPHGTDWLFEAAAETYVPLLDVCRKLADEGIHGGITLGITPILAEQLATDIFADGFIDYLTQKIEASENDVTDFSRRGESEMEALARMWLGFYRGVLENFTDRYNRDIIDAFKKLQDEHVIEIITCAATHGYLPLLGYDEAVRAQVRLGAATYRRHFGVEPRGIWLPECAYRPAYHWEFPIEGAGKAYDRAGVEEVLFENKIDYFIVDSHLLEGGKAIGAYLDRSGELKAIWERFLAEVPETAVDEPKEPYEPYLVSSTGSKKTAAIYSRDPKSALVVWSGEHGYPGDGNYLNFHKKHFPGGNRYWRVTGTKVDMGNKEVYRPELISDRIGENASHFVGLVSNTLSDYHDRTGRAGIITAPYDAELFGHWWFEGPQFIYRVLKEMHEGRTVSLTTLSAYYDENPPRTVVSIPEGSWGEGGFHWIWFNDWTKWTWKHIYEAEGRMVDIVRDHADTDDPGLSRVLRQMGRELLLMESSDWQFLISTWAARDYAEMRFSRHTEDFNRLYGIAETLIGGGTPHTGDWEFVGDMEKRDIAFGDLDVSIWRA